MQPHIPIILCGKTTAIGDVVIQHLKPEYEVVKFITSTVEGVSEIPPVLQDRKAVAVVTGGGYDDAAVEEMRAALAPDARSLAWLRLDMAKPAPPLGPEYANVLVKRLKEKLREVFESGEEVPQGIHWY